MEKLSFATFDPSYAQPPYLNSPRSLEACRRHGIHPLELVEISIEEFRRDFPNNPDAAQRRYERIDGSRRRIYGTVLSEYNLLCENGWTPDPNPMRPQKGESILAVPKEVHCEALELQGSIYNLAYKFISQGGTCELGCKSPLQPSRCSPPVHWLILPLAEFCHFFEFAVAEKHSKKQPK